MKRAILISLLSHFLLPISSLSQEAQTSSQKDLPDAPGRPAAVLTDLASRLSVHRRLPKLIQSRCKTEHRERPLPPLKVEIGQLCVTAPLDGRVLQVDILLANMCRPIRRARPSCLVGIDIDETTAPRIKAGSKSIAHLKGDSTEAFPSTFLRIDLYVIPMHSLTGDKSERVDFRVWQVIYRFQPPPFPVHVG